MKIKTKFFVTLVLLIFYQTLPGETREESKTKGFSLMPVVGYHFGYEFGKLIPLQKMMSLDIRKVEGHASRYE